MHFRIASELVMLGGRGRGVERFLKGLRVDTKVHCVLGAVGLAFQVGFFLIMPVAACSVFYRVLGGSIGLGQMWLSFWLGSYKRHDCFFLKSEIYPLH